MVSTLLCVVDPRGRELFAAASGGQAGRVERDQVCGSFLEVNVPETSAVLAVLSWRCSPSIGLPISRLHSSLYPVDNAKTG
jgi:hypothetical protein